MRLTRAVFAFACALALSRAGAIADTGYQDFTDWPGWARLHVGQRAGLASSYDRAGGNFDFSHYESTAPTCPESPNTCRNAGPVTVATLSGPGVIHRFWMPHFTSNQVFSIRMFFDGESLPRIDTTSVALLGGSLPYFQPPFIDTFAGGQSSYEPIPFAHSLRIETINHALPPSGYSPHNHYYQYSYSLFPAGTPIASYDGTRSPAEQAARSAAAAMLANTGVHPAGPNPNAIAIPTAATAIPAGQALCLADITGPGIVRRLNVRMDGAPDSDLHALRLRVRYDADTAPAIDVALDDFFGAGHGRAPYRSIPLGTDSPDGFYCFWPMPFRSAIQVELFNSDASSVAIDSALVEYESHAIDAFACYLHAQSSSSVVTNVPSDHTLVSISGRGHYVGNLLYVHQFSDNFFILEGDDRITVDGADVLYGTGLEDAYNGGYYYNWAIGLTDEPEGAFPPSAIRPMNGILHVHRTPGGDIRSDQYRWLIADPVPFTQSLDVRVETLYSTIGATWTSVAFWYQTPAGFIFPDGDVNLDGTTDGPDIAAFLDLMHQGSPDPTAVAHGDFDGSGALDAADVPGFVLSLLN